MSDDFFDRVGSEVPEECPVCGLRRKPYVDGSSEMDFGGVGIYEVPNLINCGKHDQLDPPDEECPAVEKWLAERDEET